MTKTINNEINTAAQNTELTMEELNDVNGDGRSGWDVLYDFGRGCINYGIMIGNKIFKKNAKYI